ncbi:MAG: molybdopterin-dependent oxidoreductase [Burkholderiales bacterium]|nr:molybdopterin-dependent oxidoreductase [Burkholderiales bacterium]
MSDRRPVTEQEALRESLRGLETARLPATVPPAQFPIETLVPEVRQQTPAVGQRATRPDARLHGLGQTKYIDDLALPGMLHARIKRAGIAAARIARIDTRAAEAMPGVMAVLTGREIPANSFGPSLQDQPVLADERVRHAGDGVAAVAAVTEEIAAQAVERIVVEYEPLPAVFDPFEAMREDAPRVHPPAGNVYAHKIIRKGDVERALAEADRVFEGRWTTQMVEHVPIEPHAAIAAWDANGRLTVYSTLGRITLGRADIARTLALPVNRVQVVGTIVGGNFGGKNEISQEPVLALLAKKAGRPVKGVFTRGEEFYASTTRHPFFMDYSTGVGRDGRIRARKVRLVLDGGAYCSWSETTLGKACILATGPYKIEHVQVEAFAVYTNKTVAGAMRGFGAPQVCFAYESQMDEIAAALAIDPLEIRLANAFDEGAASPTGQTLESVVVKASLEQAAARFGWREPRS